MTTTYPAALARWAEFADDLYTSCILNKPVDVDWDEVFSAGLDAGLDAVYETRTCDDCGAVITTTDDHYWTATWEGDAFRGSFEDCTDWLDDRIPDTADADDYMAECDNCNADAFDLGADGPMMNYCYPIPDLGLKYLLSEAARVISDLPLCVVDHPDLGPVLALTGGGMDLSWEIIQAHVALGFLPPIHFHPEGWAFGYTLDDDTGPVLAACWRAADVAVAWAQSGRDDIEAMVASLEAKAEG